SAIASWSSDERGGGSRDPKGRGRAKKRRPTRRFGQAEQVGGGRAMMSAARTITLALTGASGMPFGLRLLDCLLRAGTHVHLLYSPAAQVVAKQECDLTLPSQPREAARVLGERYGARPGQLNVYAREDWYAPVASGSNPGDAMAVCPCSMGTL